MRSFWSAPETRPAMAETVTVGALGHEGDAIAETAGGRLFVRFALPGETVDIDRVDPGHAVAREVRSASPERVAPVCSHFGACGGCALQHWAAPPYLAWKRSLVVNALAQRGLKADVAPAVPVGHGDRRRVVFTAERPDGGAIIGFHRDRSHALVALTECPVAAQSIAKRLPAIAAIAAAVLPRKGRAAVAVVAADNGLDVAVEYGGKARLSADSLSALARAASDPAFARVSLDGEPVLQRREPVIDIGDAVLLPTPGGFLQASAAAEAALAETVIAGVGTAARVVDLFCGIGTFSLRLARRASVIAVDGDAVALDALDRAVRRAGGLRPVSVRRRDLFRSPLSGPELKGIDAVVFDPPRAGAAAQATALAASGVPRIVAVSCNPATLARDLRILVDGGYRVVEVRPVDQFLYTPHVEAVALLERTPAARR